MNRNFSVKQQFLHWIFMLMIAVSGFSQTVPKELMIGNLRLSINEDARKQIQKDVDRLTRSQTHYDKLVDRMNLYFPYIEREHKEAGIPDEIKFLAIQESALISDAVSSSNAVGFWQFKDFTGREVGLLIDRKVDERLNIVSAAKGSGKYFNSNNIYFDNWAYAVIAYQAGAGGAKSHTEQANYGKNKITITPKTYWYLKKFIAHVVAFTPAVGRPHSKKIWLEEITNAGGKTLAKIARQEKIELEEIKKYNKWLIHGAVPIDKPYSVMIPRKGSPPKHLIAKNSSKKDNTSEAITTIYPSELKPGITTANKSTIIPLNGIPSILSHKNDDIYHMSARAGISEKKFIKYNDMGETDQIVSNKFYYIKNKKRKAKVGFHVVKAAETLWDISQEYGIKLSRLASKNRMSVTDKLKTGRVLWMNKTRPSSEPIAYHTSTVVAKPTAEKPKQGKRKPLPTTVPIAVSSGERKKVKIHTVAAGESLWSIAKIYNVAVADITRWNSISDINAIKPGQNIQVKAPIEEAAKDKNIITYTVKAGDTLYAISRKYNMTLDEIIDLNKMKTRTLNIGQKMKVYGK